MKKKAVFFDRDGTLILDKEYLSEPSQIEYYPDTFSALKNIADKGYLLFIITNQSGIGRGLFTEEQMHLVHTKMSEDFKEHDIKIENFSFCPHSPDDNCTCRKPSPEMIVDMCEQYAIDPARSYMIGDKISDAQCGENAAMTGMTIHNLEEHSYKNLDSLTQLSEIIKSK